MELSKGLLAKNTVYNLLGQLIPMLVGLITIPILINHLGIERFGVLSIIWMVVGYFSLFDLGIGRATTKCVAECLALGEIENLADLIWSSIIMLNILGIIGSLIIVLLTPWLITVLNIPPNLTNESRNTFYWLALSIPLIIGASGTRGILEAEQRFGLVNLIKIPASIATFLLPVMVLPFSVSLVPITIALVISRLVAAMVYLYYCLRSRPELMRPRLLRLSDCQKLLSFGGWLTVSNVIGPFMVYMDRFIVGAVINIQAVAYYSTPYDLITKLLIIPASLMGVMFPAFCFYSTTKPDKLISIYQRTISYTLISLSPLVLTIIIFAGPFLNLWLGNEFAVQSTLVLQILAVAVMINALAQIPYGLIQANNRPDITAILHLIEFPIYLALIWFLIKPYGIIGVAVAFLIRVVIDTGLLFWITDRMLKKKAPHNTMILNSILLILGIMVLFILISTSLFNNLHKLIICLFTIVFLLIYFWKVLLIKDERELINKFYYYVRKKK